MICDVFEFGLQDENLMFSFYHFLIILFRDPNAKVLNQLTMSNLKLLAVNFVRLLYTDSEFCSFVLRQGPIESCH